jgi:4,4'-diaponeurosporenoate glycosyltransferase
MHDVALAVAWLAGWSLYWRLPQLAGAPVSDADAASAPGAGPSVSVVIPARNEADQLPTLLGALAAQRCPADEVIVVDDDSDDGTAAVARRSGATVVESGPLPPGWTGKCRACWQGAHAARGELLVFLDADTDPGPELMRRVVAARARAGGVLSVAPYHRMQRPYERLSAFFNIVTKMGTGVSSVWAHTRARATGAFGPCLVCRRDDYLAVGGHEAIRAEVLEDAALAEQFRSAGLPVRCLGGRGAIDFRMYPAGVGQLVEGWSKNIATGAGIIPVVRLLLVAAWITAGLVVGYDAGRGLVTLAAGEPGPAIATWLLYGAFAAQLGVMLRPLGNFGPLTAALFPIPGLAFVVIFARSLVLTAVRGQVRWKGRSIPVRGADPGAPG